MEKLLLILFSLVLLTGCMESENKKETLVIYSPYPKELIRPILINFEHKENIKIVLKEGSTQVLLSQIHNQSKKNRGDVIVGGVLAEMIENPSDFEHFKSSNQGHMIYKNQQFPYVTDFLLMPTVIAVNKDLIGEIPVKGYKDLHSFELIKKVAYSNPSTTTTGYQHMKAIESINHNIKDVKKFMNSSREVQKSAEVIDGVAKGKFYAGLSYELDANNYKNKGYPIDIVYPIEGTMVNRDGIALINKDKIKPESKKLINYLTSIEVQKEINRKYKLQPAREDIKYKHEDHKNTFNNIYKIQEKDISDLTRESFLELIK